MAVDPTSPSATCVVLGATPEPLAPVLTNPIDVNDPAQVKEAKLVLREQAREDNKRVESEEKQASLARLRATKEFKANLNGAAQYAAFNKSQSEPVQVASAEPAPTEPAKENEPGADAHARVTGRDGSSAGGAGREKKKVAPQKAFVGAPAPTPEQSAKADADTNTRLAAEAEAKQAEELAKAETDAEQKLNGKVAAAEAEAKANEPAFYNLLALPGIKHLIGGFGYALSWPGGKLSAFAKSYPRLGFPITAVQYAWSLITPFNDKAIAYAQLRQTQAKFTEFKAKRDELKTEVITPDRVLEIAGDVGLNVQGVSQRIGEQYKPGEALTPEQAAKLKLALANELSQALASADKDKKDQETAAAGAPPAKPSERPPTKDEWIASLKGSRKAIDEGAGTLEELESFALHRLKMNPDELFTAAGRRYTDAQPPNDDELRNLRKELVKRTDKLLEGNKAQS